MAQYNVRDDTMYGLSREAAAKIEAKYDPKMESEARAWIEAVLGESLGDGTLHDVLKNGIALCNVVRKIAPDVIPPPSKAAMPFKQMENIGNYLSACTNLGMSAHDSFQTVDLYEGKNMVAVSTQIHRLGSIAASRGYAGPTLGVKTANKNVREFTEEQKRAGLAETTFMGKGSHGTPGSEMKTSELLGSEIVKTNIETKGKIAGMGQGGATTFLGGGGAVDMSTGGVCTAVGVVIGRLKAPAVDERGNNGVPALLRARKGGGVGAVTIIHNVAAHDARAARAEGRIERRGRIGD